MLEVPSSLVQFSKWSHREQQPDFQSTTSTSYFYKSIYFKLTYVYFNERILQDKSIHVLFTFPNLMT
jgi:hypothetical protein